MIDKNRVFENTMELMWRIYDLTQEYEDCIHHRDLLNALTMATMTVCTDTNDPRRSLHIWLEELIDLEDMHKLDAFMDNLELLKDNRI